MIKAVKFMKIMALQSCAIFIFFKQTALVLQKTKNDTLESLQSCNFYY